MTSPYKAIKIALDTKLATLGGTTPVAWENIRYEPVIGRMYLRPTLLLGQSSDIDLQVTQVNRGIYQVDVFFPVNKGQSEMLDKMDAIYNLFKGQILTVSGTDVHINSISISRFLTEQAWIVGSVEVSFSCYK